jgi:arsenite methyltransferase
VISRPVPLGGRSDSELWAECVVGASIDEDYLALFREAGFTDVEALNEHDYFAESPSADTRRIASSLGARAMEVTMRRPAHARAAGLVERLSHRLHPKRLNRVSKRGLWGAVAAFAALIACYGTMGLIGILALLGIGLAVDEGIWAMAIAGAAVLAAIATGFNLRRHGQPWPLVLAVVGAAIIVYVMFVSYSMIVEAIGFAVLIAAVGLDLRNVYKAECVPKRSRRQVGDEVTPAVSQAGE